MMISFPVIQFAIYFNYFQPRCRTLRHRQTASFLSASIAHVVN